MRGRRRSPGPPGGFRRDDRRYIAPRDRRRRSISPERYRRGGSPPPFKRGRYARDADDFYPPRGYDHGGHSQRPSLQSREGPRTYKDFCRTLPDDVTPEEAQKEYQQYLAEYWGSEVRADFEAKKNEEWMKKRFDPHWMEKALYERNEEAKKAASSFAQNLKAGLLDPGSDDFNQGAGALAPDEGGGPDKVEDAATKPTQVKLQGQANNGEALANVLWKPERITSDIGLSSQLIHMLDKEKGIECAVFDLAQPEYSVKGEPAAENGTQASAQPEDASQAALKPDGDAKAEIPAVEAKSSESQGTREAAIGKLDLRLTYLWKVHGVDYYSGKELSDPSQYEKRMSKSRSLRGPKPEDGEQASEVEDRSYNAEKKNTKLAERRVDQVWKKRLVSTDPFTESMQKEKVEKLTEDWIEDQVKKIADNKWGCKLSQKLFVGKDYVLKHVRLKHTEKVEDQRKKFLEDVFYDNYKRFRDEEQKLMQAELDKVQQAMTLQQSGAPGAWEGGGPGQAPSRVENLGAFPGAGFPIGMQPLRAGPVMHPRQMMMPGPGQMLVLAPGAGPMGPFISVPIPEGPGVQRRSIGPGQGPPLRGPRGGRPREDHQLSFGSPGSGGARPLPRGAREYFDLDNPSNNRAVLDYGDL